MRTISLGLLTVFLFSSALPAEALIFDTGSCKIARRTARARCERNNQSSGAATSRSRVQNVMTPEKALILERRQLRRSDLKDRLGTRNTNVDRLRLQRTNALKERRRRTHRNFQNRIDQKRTRAKEQQTDRARKLRSFVRSVDNRNFLEKYEQRRRGRNLQSSAQQRRQDLRKAHEECKKLNIGDGREECLRKARHSAR